MAFQEKQLGQARENSTNAVSVYSPGSGVTGIIKTIFLANTSGLDARFRLFVDDDGTTYDESTAIAWDVDIEADQMIEIDCFVAMDNSSGNFAYRSSVANAITITVFGAEVS